MKQRKRRKISNETKIIILLNIITIGLLIYKITKYGLSFLSTIGYLN